MTRSPDNSSVSDGPGEPAPGGHGGPQERPQAEGGTSCLAEIGLCLGMGSALSLVCAGPDWLGAVAIHVGLLLALIAGPIAVVAIVRSLMARSLREGLLGGATLVACAAYVVLLPRAVDLRGLDHIKPSWLRRLLDPRPSPAAPAGAFRRGPGLRPQRTLPEVGNPRTLPEVGNLREVVACGLARRAASAVPDTRAHPR